MTDVQDPSPREENHGATDEPRMEAHFKWADDILDIERTSKATVFLPEEPLKAENEWPTLPQTDATRQHTTELPKHQHGVNKQNKSDRGPSVVTATTSDTRTLMDTAGTGLTCIRKQRLDKSNEQLNEQKRMRNRIAPPTKDKH
jgi:hypothetical protein